MKSLLFFSVIAAQTSVLLAGVSVRDFGAVGDGKTDDTRAIQAALDSGKKVIIPEGTFLITNALEPASNQEIELIGTLKVADANIQRVVADVPAGQPRVTVADAGGFYVGQWVSLADDSLPTQGGSNRQTRPGGADCGRIAAIEGNTLVLAQDFSKGYGDTRTFRVAANARVGAQPSAILIEDKTNVHIYGRGAIDGNKAGQFDVEPVMLDRRSEETRAGCGITIHANTPGGAAHITVEGVTIRNAILHNISLYGARYSSVSGVTCIGAHDKNILLRGCDSCRIQSNTCLRSDFEDGIILYSGNRHCLVQGNICADNPRLGIAVNAFQIGIRLSGNISVNNVVNFTLRGDHCSSTGDFSSGGSVGLQGRGNTVTGLVARGNVNVSATDLLVSGGVISGEADQPLEVGMTIARPSLDHRVAPVERVRVQGVLFSRCETAVRVSGVVKDVRLVENRFHDNDLNVEIAEECRGEVSCARNEGYATENSGTARIASPSRSVTVFHGLTVAPRLSDISVTPANDLGNAKKFWIAQPTETGFDILVDADPGAAGAEFVWFVRPAD